MTSALYQSARRHGELESQRLSRVHAELLEYVLCVVTRRMNAHSEAERDIGIAVSESETQGNLRFS